MTNYLVFSATLLFFGCQSRSSEQSARESAETQPNSQTAATNLPDTLCFRQVMSHDTTTLKLFISGQRASGYLDSNPYEKDRARGTLQGTVDNTHILVDWQRSGEGTTQVYPLDVTMHGDTLSWYEGERVERQGKWVLKEPKAGYKFVLTKISCP